MRRIWGVALAGLMVAVAVPSIAGGAEDGLLSNVPRAQFVPSIGQGSLVRTPAAPLATTPKVADGDSSEWETGVRPTGLGGTTTIQAGQLIYQDWILDDTGAARSCVVARRDRNAPVEELLGWSKHQPTDSALGEELIPDVDVLGVFERPETECEKGVEKYGAVRYPAGKTEGSADILEVRLAADAAALHVLVGLNALTPTDDPVTAIAVDTDFDAATGAGAWGLGSGIATPGAEAVFHVTRQGVTGPSGAAVPGSRSAVDDLGSGAPSNPDGFGGVIEASIPRVRIGSGSPWRIWIGSGVWDSVSSRWAAPVAVESGPAVYNLAFRGEAEPLRPYMDEAQAFALRRSWDATAGVSRLGGDFAAVVDVNALSSGAHESWQVGPGHYVRIFESRVTDGQRNGQPRTPAEAGPVSARQPYGLYVPKAYDPLVPPPLTLWLHWRGPGDHMAAYYVPNMVHQLAEARGSLLVSPRGRGSSGWYVGDSQVDVLDAMSDAKDFVGYDPDRVTVAGYSMGGWGAYLLSMLYPDRFAGALVVAGPPVLGFWPWPFEPMEPQNGRPLYNTNPLVANARHVPTMIMHGSLDELVPVSGVTQQARTYLDNRQPHRYALFAGYEHFSFALADEWSVARSYLGSVPPRRLLSPGRVSYTRVPCLDPVRWSPLYDTEADSAYWIRSIRLAAEPAAGVCTSQGTPAGELGRSGTVDFSVVRRDVNPASEGPVVSGGGPPDHTGAYSVTGYDRKENENALTENNFTAQLRNVRSFTVLSGVVRLSNEQSLFGTVTTDTPVTITFQGLSGGTLQIDNSPVGAFTGTVTVPAGHHFVSVIR